MLSVSKAENGMIYNYGLAFRLPELVSVTDLKNNKDLFFPGSPGIFSTLKFRVFFFFEQINQSYFE